MTTRGRTRSAAAVVALAWVVIVVVLVIGALTSDAGDDADPSSTYTVVEEKATDVGVAAVVSVRTDEAPADVIAEVLADHRYASVTMVCEGSDLEEDGWVLQGTVDDGELHAVVARADLIC